MLALLKVAGFAIIDEIQIEFEDGLNVITGETGAGKSIIINALATLLNSKVSQETVRNGSNNAEIIGYFISKGEELILKRVINASGRSRALLNDDPITLNRLEELGESLIHIYGQNEFQYLLDKKNYIPLLDRIFGLDHLRTELFEKVKELKGLSGILEVKKRELEGRDKEMELIQFQIDEIEQAHLNEGEEERLKQSIKTLREADKIRNILHTIADGLYDKKHRKGH